MIIDQLLDLRSHAQDLSGRSRGLAARDLVVDEAEDLVTEPRFPLQCPGNRAAFMIRSDDQRPGRVPPPTSEEMQGLANDEPLTGHKYQAAAECDQRPPTGKIEVEQRVGDEDEHNAADHSVKDLFELVDRAQDLAR